MIASLDPDTVLDIAGFAVKVCVVLVALGLPAQALLVVASRSEQRRRRVIATVGAAAVVLVAAVVTDVAYYSYDGILHHTLVLWVTLAAFSLPAHLLLFLGIFRLKRILPRLAALTGGTALMLLGVLAFGARTLAYGFQHSLGGWPGL
jgi:hypothetical protein